MLSDNTEHYIAVEVIANKIKQWHKGDRSKNFVLSMAVLILLVSKKVSMNILILNHQRGRTSLGLGYQQFKQALPL